MKVLNFLQMSYVVVSKLLRYHFASINFTASMEIENPLKSFNWKAF